ncbi:uncharacterized protein [Battus philenor]|uniref:uncharacterized protein isoform X3 n=1 Tax=Battus philenor TaxID=42288 RepID=UPI0035D094E4
MSKFYALYANESGYALIRVVDHNKMRAHLSHGKEYKKDIEEFTSLVQVTALVVFQSSAEVRAYNRAISNTIHLHIHHLTKGIMPDDKGLTKSTEKSSTKPRSQTKLEEFKGEEADPGLRLQLRGGRNKQTCEKIISISNKKIDDGAVNRLRNFVFIKNLHSRLSEVLK